MAAVVVKSLKALQALVEEFGDAEVEVNVVGPLEKLCDAPGMYKLLTKMEDTKNWKVKGISKLQPVIHIAKTVQKASFAICKLIPFFDPEVDKIVLDLSKDTSLYTIGRLTKKLEKIGKELVECDFEDVKWLSDDILELVDGLKGGRWTDTLKHYTLCQSRRYCSEAYNMVTPLDDADDKGVGSIA